jgi:hypothetical protein
MGVLYHVYPLVPEMLDWLDERRVAYPPNVRGRRATPREIRAATAALDRFVVKYNGDDDFTQVVIHSGTVGEGPWTYLDIVSRSGPDDPADFYFDKGWPEAIIPVLINLSRATGPLVLIEDAGSSAVVVTPDKSTDSVMSEWEFTSDPADDASARP